jgi:hypothetical protein
MKGFTGLVPLHEPTHPPIHPSTLLYPLSSIRYPLSAIRYPLSTPNTIFCADGKFGDRNRHTKQVQIHIRS